MLDLMNELLDLAIARFTFYVKCNVVIHWAYLKEAII